jgi:hypothetical protein
MAMRPVENIWSAPPRKASEPGTGATRCSWIRSREKLQRLAHLRIVEIGFRPVRIELQRVVGKEPCGQREVQGRHLVAPLRHVAVGIALGQALADGEEIGPGPVGLGRLETRFAECRAVVVHDDVVPLVRDHVLAAVVLQRLAQGRRDVPEVVCGIGVAGDVGVQRREEVARRDGPQTLDREVVDVVRPPGGDLRDDLAGVVRPRLDRRLDRVAERDVGKALLEPILRLPQQHHVALRAVDLDRELRPDVAVDRGLRAPGEARGERAGENMST